VALEVKDLRGLLHQGVHLGQVRVHSPSSVAAAIHQRLLPKNEISSPYTITSLSTILNYINNKKKKNITIREITAAGALWRWAGRRRRSGGSRGNR
jgi:hypothetical protein